MIRLERASLLVLLMAMTLLLSSLTFAWLHITSASDGARLGPYAPFGESPWQPNGVLATPLQGEDDGLQQNDLIVAVNGVGIEMWLQAPMSPAIDRPEWKPGQIIVYSVVRDGIPRDVPIRLRAYPL